MNVLKRFISHFFPIQVCKTVSSENQTNITVQYYQGAYILQTDHAVYSHTKHYTSFQSALQTCTEQLPSNSSILVLGWGLGSIGNILSNLFPKNKFQITAVEYDEKIIALYQTYNAQPQVIIHNIDAMEYVSHTIQQYELICVDIFIENKVPPAFTSSVFLLHLKKIARKNGILLFSIIADTKESIQVANQFYNDIFSKMFSRTEIIKTKGNFIYKAIM